LYKRLKEIQYRALPRLSSTVPFFTYLLNTINAVGLLCNSTDNTLTQLQDGDFSQLLLGE